MHFKVIDKVGPTTLRPAALKHVAEEVPSCQNITLVGEAASQEPEIEIIAAPATPSPALQAITQVHPPPHEV